MSSSTSTQMLIPEIVTLNFDTNSSGSFYIYAKPDSSEIVTITHLEFGRATHRAAHIFGSNSECSNDGVVAILALSDTILYQAIIAGLMTANFIPFPISPRNSVAAILQLLRLSSCHRIVATCVTLGPLLAALKTHIAEVEPDFDLSLEEVPAIAAIYPNLGFETETCPFEPYPTQVPRPSLDDTAIYIHSSGSTGLPKAIAHTHRTVAEWFTMPCVAETLEIIGKPLGNMALPAFHLYGVISQLLQPLSGSHVAVYPPTATSSSALPMLPSPDNILEHARKTKCKSLTMVPAILGIWFNSPPAVEYLKTLDRIIWAGGPLPQRIGDGLTAAGVHLQCGYGCTETGAISTAKEYEVGDAKEWGYFRITDKVKVRWAPQGDGTFECQVLSCATHHPSVENLPDVPGYATSDLCVNHPQKKHLWRVVGRIDDTIIHTSGEKTVPAPMETIVESSPRVAGAVVFGSKREQTGILIQPTSDLQIDVQNGAELEALRNEFWPIIEDANNIAPAFSRIFKEMIVFTSPGRPLPRAAKGTVQRKAAIALYAPEIESIYNTVEQQTGPIDSIIFPTAWESGPIQEWLSTMATSLCNEKSLSPTADLFQKGFDSLTATIFRLRVMRALRSQKDATIARAADNIAQNLLYSYPTIEQLSSYLTSLMNGTLTPPIDAGLLMEELIAKYSPADTSVSKLKPSTVDSVVILLTGTTGHLGSQVLATLLKDNKTSKIYAFNRPSTARTLADRQLHMFNERGLDTILLASVKLVYVEGQTDQNNLGLTPELYEEIRTSVTLIIHNAWEVDFNMTLGSFEPHIQGTSRLIDLAFSSPQNPRFVFTSSIGVAQCWDPSRGPVPEDILSDTSVALGGYGQSKYVSEQILAKSGLNFTCVRIGQVCGSLPNGVWSTSDWLPVLVKTSITLGCLPLADGLVSWIDFDTVAQAIKDIGLLSGEDSDCLDAFIHLVHPRPVSWNFIMTTVRDVLLETINECPDLKFVEFSHWIKELQACEVRGSYVKESLPGLKLLDFFGKVTKYVGCADKDVGGIIFSMGKAYGFSSAMRDANVIGKKHVEAWVNYWHVSGFM